MLDANSSPGCPPDESLAAFADGLMDAPQRDRVSAHLLLCPDCYRLFLEVAELRGAGKEA
ncbi:MAG TPA: zf-HC2 domain-containing protein [Thermoanaerobaculia bacterium]